MKKTIETLMEKLKENSNGTLNGGFASIKGGMALFKTTNSGGSTGQGCSNTGQCTGINTGACTNSGDCTQSTNSSVSCTNSTACHHH